MKNYLTLLILAAFPLLAVGQDAPLKASFFPEGRLFQAIILDPNESQSYGSIVNYWSEEEQIDIAYLPFAVGFHKSLIRWNKRNPTEISFDVAAQAQFEWNLEDGKSERNFRNVDYRASALLHHRVDENNAFRIRFFHVSSHLGDDYILRNGITSYFPNPNNYEQLDFLWSVNRQQLRYYGGMGLVVRPKTIRKRLSFQTGLFYEMPLKSQRPLGFFAGADLKMLAENEFNPGLKIGTGLRIGKSKNHPVRLMLEFYRGNLPYSPFEFTRVQWLGLGVYFEP